MIALEALSFDARIGQGVGNKPALHQRGVGILMQRALFTLGAGFVVKQGVGAEVFAVAARAVCGGLAGIVSYASRATEACETLLAEEAPIEIRIWMVGVMLFACGVHVIGFAFIPAFGVEGAVGADDGIGRCHGVVWGGWNGE